MKKPSPLFACETKLRVSKFNYRLHFSSFNNHFVVDSNGRWGELVIFWSDNMKVQVLSYSLSHIEVIILNSFNHPSWRFISFYGSSYSSTRACSWDLIDKVYCSDNLPTLVGGD